MEQENKSSYRKWIYGALMAGAFVIGGAIGLELRLSHLKSKIGNSNCAESRKINFLKLTDKSNCVRVDLPLSERTEYFFSRDNLDVDEMIIVNYRDKKYVQLEDITPADISLHLISPRYFNEPLIDTQIKRVLNLEELELYGINLPPLMPSKK